MTTTLTTRTRAGTVKTYLETLPTRVPADQALVHNHVRPTRRLNSRGFRAWLTAPDPGHLTACACGWMPELGTHFRVVAGEGAERAQTLAGEAL